MIIQTVGLVIQFVGVTYRGFPNCGAPGMKLLAPILKTRVLISGFRQMRVTLPPLTTIAGLSAAATVVIG